MVVKVYTPAEVAEILRVSEDSVLTVIERGDLPAFFVLGEPRIAEPALEGFISAGSHSSIAKARSRPGGRRRREPAAEQACRRRVIEKIRNVAPDLALVYGRSCFSANGKQLIVRVATRPLVMGYWFGFKAELLRNNGQTFLVLGLADREDDLVVPYGRFREAIDGLSESRDGHKKFFIQVKSGSYFLVGRGIEEPLLLDRYVNAFDLLA